MRSCKQLLRELHKEYSDYELSRIAEKHKIKLRRNVIYYNRKKIEHGHSPKENTAIAIRKLYKILKEV
jgi:hypothetical protein